MTPTSFLLPQRAAFGESSMIPPGEDLLLCLLGRESAKMWAEDVSDDVAIQTARTKAWAKDLWNDLANPSWVKNISGSRKRRKEAEEVKSQEMENPRCWCRDCVPGRQLPQFMLPRACELIFVEKG
jgi:hypothetical protein